MKRRTKLILSICATAIIAAAVIVIGITRSEPEKYSPVIDPANFVTVVDNPYLPLTPGTLYVYEGVSADGNERNEVNVTSETRTILGVTCVVVKDTVLLNGELVEATLDWYAQDKDGNVWYFGEDSKEYSGGVVVSTEGSWEAGVDGAQPGIVMKAHPAVGDKYRQEYYKDQAEDMAEVLALNTSANVTYGSFTNCTETKEWTPLERGVVENKYYAPGIGVVLEQMVKGGTDRMQLVQIITSP